MSRDGAVPQIWVDQSGDTEIFLHNIQKAITSGAKSLLLLASDIPALMSANVDQALKQVVIPVFGGIFTKLLVNHEVLAIGTVVCGFDFEVKVHTIRHLSDPEIDYSQQLNTLELETQQNDTLLIVVDGFSKRTAVFLDNLYEAVGNLNCKYLGGGAGSLALISQPCLFSNQGLLADSGQVIRLPTPISLSIKHNWQKFTGPFCVTETNNNIIISLNYKPAFEIYKTVVEADSGLRFHENNFLELAKTYPFGLDRLQGNLIVRAPIANNGSDLICLGEVPINHMIYILKEAAEPTSPSILQNNQSTIEQLNSIKKPILALVFNCMSSASFLQKTSGETIKNIYHGLPQEVPLLGALSIGEIADTGNACLEIGNKTMVLGILGAPELDTL